MKADVHFYLISALTLCYKDKFSSKSSNSHHIGAANRFVRIYGEGPPIGVNLLTHGHLYKPIPKPSPYHTLIFHSPFSFIRSSFTVSEAGSVLLSFSEGANVRSTSA